MDSLTEYLRAGSIDWFDISYIGDWLITTLLWFISGLVDQYGVYERDFSLDDPLINHPHTKQQVSGFMNNMLSFILPLCLVISTSAMRRSLLEMHHGVLGLWVSKALSRLITEFLKNRVGRLRPDFLARCKWGETLKQCTGNFADIKDGRMSFPSGHSSTAFSGMTFLFLWLSAKTAAWSLGEPLPARNPWIFASRMGRITATLLPFMFATWVAVSRVEDYRHHKEDVIIGSLIGIACGSAGYLCFWPNPFSCANHANGIAGQPRLLYRNSDARSSRNNGYELAGLEDGLQPS